MKNKRLVFKLSGEALSDKKNGQIFDVIFFENLYKELKITQQQGYEIIIVVGGGNIWRGREAAGIKISDFDADYMGMMATMINATSLYSFLKTKNLKVEVFDALKSKEYKKEIDLEKANTLLEEGYIVIFGGGTGKPFCSTDTATAMRANELNASRILIGKNGVDGIYDKDPNKFTDASFFSKITYDEIEELNLNVFDLKGIELLKGKNIDIILFNMNEVENFSKAINNKLEKYTRIIGE